MADFSVPFRVVPWPTAVSRLNVEGRKPCQNPGSNRGGGIRAAGHGAGKSGRTCEEKRESGPVNLTVTQMLKIGHQPLTLQVGARYWADTPDSPDTTGPKGWGLRFAVSFLFPKQKHKSL